MAGDCAPGSIVLGCSEWREWLSARRPRLNRWLSVPACCHRPHALLPTCLTCATTTSLPLTRTRTAAAPNEEDLDETEPPVASFDLVETEEDEEEEVGGGTSTPGTTAGSSRVGRAGSTVRTGSSENRPAGVGAGPPAGGMAGSRSSVSSMDSERHEVAMSKRWTTFETVGRCMLLMSVAFFIVGVLITVFGFLNTGIPQANKVPLQIIGPACLAMTLVMWGTGGVFSRLWNMEWKRQQQAIELRDRVQLHALAMDILNRPVLSQGMLHDPRLRRQLMMKLRQQKALDMSSEMASRRSSRAVSIDSRRRQSSACGTLLQHEIDRRKSLGKDVIGEDIKGLPFELPGIQISRIETLDLGEGSVAGGSGSNRGGSMSFIIINDVSSDLSRLSCPSDYSLAGSTSRSRSRSSRASSGVSSRLWDFSPRDSEWDADVSLGSRDSQLNISKQDWGGGPNGEYTLSPTAPRKMPVVKFDMSSPLRRHSSPASAGRRKDSGCECTCGKSSQASATEYPSVLKNRDMSCHAFRPQDEMQVPCSSMRKRSADQSFLSVRIDEDERELDELDETTPLRNVDVPTEERRPLFAQRPTYYTHICPAAEETIYMERRDSRTIRPPLKRNNTDDSEVERRVAKLFKEIEFSVSDSVDESKINSQEYESNVRRVEAQTQTLNDHEIEKMSQAVCLESSFLPKRGGFIPATSRMTGGLHSLSFGDNTRGLLRGRDSYPLSRAATEEPTGTSLVKSKEKRSRLSALSHAFSHLGRRANTADTAVMPSTKPKNMPRRFLVHLGLSDESTRNTDMEAGRVQQTPPSYDNIVNEII